MLLSRAEVGPHNCASSSSAVSWSQLDKSGYSHLILTAALRAPGPSPQLPDSGSSLPSGRCSKPWQDFLFCSWKEENSSLRFIPRKLTPEGLYSTFLSTSFPPDVGVISTTPRAAQPSAETSLTVASCVLWGYVHSTDVICLNFLSGEEWDIVNEK